jgi:hypothetical protein
VVETTDDARLSGRTSTEDQAIVNTVTAYSYFFDEGRWEEFFALFSEDILFENTTPVIGTIISRGKKAFR